MRILVAGWFSFEQMGASAGDLLARDVLCNWLAENGYAYDVAVAPPFTGGIDWRSADPCTYSHVAFVCGPFGNGPPVTGFLERFAGCRLVGLNLSMLQALEEWNPFELLLERDSSRCARPDLAFLAPPSKVPIIGVVLVHQQPEYGVRALDREASAAIERLVDLREASIVHIDTRFDTGANALRTPGEVEALIARMDTVITTRLHGLVLAIKNGVPALAIDAVAGGAKVQRQATAIGWPVIFTADKLTDRALWKAFDYCLTSQAREEAKRCRLRAIEALKEVRVQLLSTLAETR
jgi:hypothetical protein